MPPLCQSKTEPPIDPATRWAWVAVGLLWFVALLNYVDRLALTTMRESVLGSVPMTEAQFGLLTSVFLWVYGILRGRLKSPRRVGRDRWARRDSPRVTLR